MRVVYAVCSERGAKPVTRAVLESRAEAEELMVRLRREESGDPEDGYWVAELGPESESWLAVIDDKGRVGP